MDIEQRAKAKWQRLHAKWVKAMDAGDGKTADRLMRQCDALLPLFSKYWKGKTVADVKAGRAALSKSRD